MKPGMRVVATFNDRDDAQRVRDRLEEAGIHAELADESTYQRYWYVSKPQAAEKVYVAEENFDKAREFLQMADKEDHILRDELRCPDCGSVRIEYPQFTRKFLGTTFVEIACFLGIIDKEFYCKDCQHTWPAKVDLRPRTDLLNWPKGRPIVRQEKG